LTETREVKHISAIVEIRTGQRNEWCIDNRVVPAGCWSWKPFWIV